jgi:hypothetical protein
MKELKLRSGWEIARAVGLGAALFLLAFLAPVIYDIDGISMFTVAESLVTRGTSRFPKLTELSVTAVSTTRSSIRCYRCWPYRWSRWER